MAIHLEFSYSLVRGLMDVNLPWPAVSQSWSLTVLSSKYIVLERKSIPIVAWYVLSNESYMNLNFEISHGWTGTDRRRTSTSRMVRERHLPGDKRGFTDWLFAEKDQFEFAKRISKVRGHFFLNKFMVFCTFSLFSRLFTENLENIKRGKEININRLKWVITSSPSGISGHLGDDESLLMSHKYQITDCKSRFTA